MPEYRRPHIPGAAVFLTIVTYHREPLFANEANIDRLRDAIVTVKLEMPFEVTAAVILPDHLHYLWTRPIGDNCLSARVGKMKLVFTQSLRGSRALPEAVSPSRLRHRESDVWQRRFIDHVVRDQVDFETHLNYIHYNPVKHGLVACPHLWPHSSFHAWVRRGAYDIDWCCACQGRMARQPDFRDIPGMIGE